MLVWIIAHESSLMIHIFHLKNSPCFTYIEPIFRIEWSWTSRIGRFKAGLRLFYLNEHFYWSSELSSDWSRVMAWKRKPFQVIWRQSLIWILLWMILFGIKCLTTFNIHLESLGPWWTVHHGSKLQKTQNQNLWKKISKNFDHVTDPKSPISANMTKK